MALAYIVFHAACIGVCCSMLSRTMDCPFDRNGFRIISIFVGPLMLIILFAYHKAEAWSPDMLKMEDRIRSLEDKVYDKTILEYE